MRADINFESNYDISNAASSGTTRRGLGEILKGRDPRDAWAVVQRICGVCSGPHALASVRSVEDALDINIPENANAIRNIMQLSQQIHDHLVNFYHLNALDRVNPVNALKADPKATSALQQQVSPHHPLHSPGYFRDFQNRLKKFMESGQPGPFKNGYWISPACLLPPEMDLMAVTHYLEALDFQKIIMETQAILGGENAHPNWEVGGVPCPINLDDIGAIGTLNTANLKQVHQIIKDTKTFVDTVYIPDILAIGKFSKGSLYGGGISCSNVLAYGDIPDKANDYSVANLMMPRGAIINGNLNEIHEIDHCDPEQLQEFVPHSRCKYPNGVTGLHPWASVNDPVFDVSKTAGAAQNIEELGESAISTGIKALRWRGHAMEVGPLARYIVGYAQGHEYFTEQINMTLKALDVPLSALFSALGRTATRALEAQWAAEQQLYFFDKLITNIKAGDSTTTQGGEIWDPVDCPKDANGAGFTEAPGGALAHWIHIKNGRIDNYQCVVPTTWNGSPVDEARSIGAFEASMMNTRFEAHSGFRNCS